MVFRAGDKTRLTHGEAKPATRLYRIYRNMLTRCYNKNFTEYGRYGGRGIAVCAEWREGYEPFRDWARSNGYADHLAIDRIDNDAGYAPSNCRWVTPAENNINQRTNVVLEFNGVAKPVSEWAKDAVCHVTASTLRRRLGLGWDAARAITTPNLPPMPRPRRADQIEATLLTECEDHRMYAASQGRRAWQIHHHFADNRWEVQNRFGHSVMKHGRLWLHIVAACRNELRRKLAA